MKISTKHRIYLNAQFNDIEDLSQSVKGWGIDFRQLDCGAFKAILRQIGTSSALLSYGRFNRHIDQKGSTPPGFRTLALLSSGSPNRLIWRNREIGPNDLMLFPPDGELSAVSWNFFNVFTVSLTGSLLSHVSRLTGLPEFGDLTRDMDVASCSGVAMMNLRRLLHRISRTTPQEEDGDDVNDLFYPLEYETPKMILSILETARDTQKGISPRRIHSLSRAEEVIKNQIQEPLTVRKLSLLTGMTERALHYAFMEKYGMSTKAYLQATRFNAVRRELKNADPRSIRVIDVANHWGFWHMGQFAKDYRTLFGKLPSETLHHS